MSKAVDHLVRAPVQIGGGICTPSSSQGIWKTWNRMKPVAHIITAMSPHLSIPVPRDQGARLRFHLSRARAYQRFMLSFTPHARDSWTQPGGLWLIPDEAALPEPGRLQPLMSAHTYAGLVTDYPKQSIAARNHTT